MLRLSSDDSAEIVNLDEGSLELKGTTASGKGYTLTADVEKVIIVNDRGLAEINSWETYAPYSVVTNNDYYLKFKIKEDANGVQEAYRVSLDTVDVERTARILADDRTAAALEAARVRVGAPEHAKFDFGFHPMGNTASLEATILEPRQPVPVMVHFYWTEKVVK